MPRWSCAVVWCWLGAGSSAWSAQVLGASLQCVDPGSTMLWQVQGPALQGRKVSVQLLGCIHVGQPGVVAITANWPTSCFRPKPKRGPT